MDTNFALKFCPKGHIHLALTLSLLTIACATFYGLSFRRKQRSPLPPGPKPLPIIGNIHSMFRKSPMDCLQAWHKQFGPVIAVRYGQRRVVSVSSYRVAQELMNKKSMIYSSRPRFIMASERMTGSLNMAIIPYNKRWQNYNHIAGSLLDAGAVRRYAPLLNLESTYCLREMKHSDDFSKSLARFSASMLLTLGYGIHLPRSDCVEPDELERINDLPFQALGQSHSLLIELFPVLDYIPYAVAPWKWTAERTKNETTALHMKHLATGLSTSTWNWSHEVKSLKVGQLLSDEELAYCIGTIEQAGFGAILTVARLLVKAIVLHPEYAKRAQDELDRVVGQDRLPCMEDQERLPWLDAMINEAMRWQPPTPFAIPHANTKDDVYKGYVIPKDTMVIPNLWVMAFDAEDFPDPYTYRPERWLRGEPVQHSSFGFGRRICPGRHLGYTSVFLVISRLLWAYNISHAYRDGKKVEIDPWDLNFTFTAASNPFKASFQVRSPKHSQLIETAWENSERDVGKILEGIKPRRG
ncbi:hypothetical protein JDV02_010725 [Purpureocillium takamizusanense]|uniref:Cytochrome P450 n=1 Tax=Purpureocillium takamizusanense TaxID=2060973 RepID=A0A9Q8QT95_9HYPO|nr:uncharacterized protein JDV02_010725 [Purpureocillium takamizusanense]UNI25017.1 hypothetical protein JDV02_010725 [Purpureocillium takamizusanense]